MVGAPAGRDLFCSLDREFCVEAHHMGQPGIHDAEGPDGAGEFK